MLCFAADLIALNRISRAYGIIVELDDYPLRREYCVSLSSCSFRGEAGVISGA